MRGAVWLKGDVALGRIGVAGLAGLQSVAVVDHRIVIVDPLDAMRTMTVVTLGRFPIAKPGNFAVVGIHIAVEVVLVAVAAIGRDSYPAGNIVWFFNTMRRMTVGTDGRIGITAAELITMYRCQVGVAYIGVAFTTDTGDVFPAIDTDLLVNRCNVVGIVTAVAGRVGARLVIDIWSGMHRGHITLDLLCDLAQAGVVTIVACRLCLFPQIHVAFHASNLPVYSFPVFGLDDIRVATHTIAATMNALFEFIRTDMQFAWVTVDVFLGVVLLAMAFKTFLVGKLGV